jgi:hypothetical protein
MPPEVSRFVEWVLDRIASDGCQECGGKFVQDSGGWVASVGFPDGSILVNATHECTCGYCRVDLVSSREGSMASDAVTLGAETLHEMHPGDVKSDRELVDGSALRLH